MAAIAYYLITIVSLVHGEVSVATQHTKYPTEVMCLTAAIKAQQSLKANELARCDPGGPDIPTQMELAYGE